MYETKYHQIDLANSAILLTGGAGFIGSNLVEYLVKYGIKKLRILDNLSTGNLENIKDFIGLPNVEFIEGDIRDIEICQASCKGMDYVLHQAALGSVPRSIKDPLTTNAVNISGFLNVLVAAKDNSIKKMVYAASSSTYGDSKELPKVEERIGKPLSPYAITKYVNELYADVFYSTYGLETVGLRYFNVFGPKQNPNGAYAAVIPKFMDAALKNVGPIINGDGKTSRDFTFVDNVVQCNLKALSSSQGAEVMNVACGSSVTLNELWDLIKKMAKTDAEAIYAEERIGDIKHSLANISKAKGILGYNPNYLIEDGLRLTFDWFKK